MRITLVGVNHRDAPIEVRERLHLDDAATRRLLTSIRGSFPGCEAFVLSTCNRTEVLFLEPDGHRAAEVWHLLLETAGQAGDVPACAAAATSRTHLTGDAAVRHLLRVVAGLDSAVLGDTELLGQVRAARDLAVEAGTVGKHLHALLRLAVSTGRRARRETSVAAGGAGIGSAVAVVVDERVPLEAPVLVLGAGVAAETVLSHLHRRGHRDLTVANRTRARAVEVALAVGASVIDWAAVPAALARVDVVVAATAGGRVVPADVWDGVLATRGHAPLVVDTALPRAVEPHPDVEVIGLDDLTRRRDETLERRQRAVPIVEDMIEEALDAWRQRERHAGLDQHVGALYAMADRWLASFGQSAEEGMQRELRRQVRRALHDHATALRASISEA